MSRQGLPTFAFLADDKGFASLALRLQRIELLLQALFRGLARIDRTTKLWGTLGAISQGRPTPMDSGVHSHAPAER
jgi:hypothetical protein